MSRLTVPAWFVSLSVVRVASLLDGRLGADGHLYRAATIEWLAGGDPWHVQVGSIYFAAPPPTLLVMAPFALVPEPVALAAIVALGIGGSLWAFNRLGLPWWWLAFPPLVDGLVNANPHVLLMPLLLSGVAWLAPAVKVYAAPVMLLRLQYRALLIAAALTLVTVPLTPWPTFFAELPRILELLRSQSRGGLSVWQAPLLIVPALVAMWFVGRERAAWWIVPVFWPSTQYYYSSLAIPGLTPVAAIVLSGQLPGVPAVALVAVAIEIAVRRYAATRAENRIADSAPEPARTD